jgi:phosphoribosylformimino-5-aminoimidazole carboxamide ribotide isomerase
MPGVLVIPSIDVRGGLVVRLLRGDYARETVYDTDPVGAVHAFLDSGARRVHIVDLDAARGRPDEDSAAAVRAAVHAAAAAGADAQVGGGVRSVEAVESWLEAGAAYVVMGSVAAREPQTAEAIAVAHPHRVLAGLDVSHGAARTQGWTEDGGEAMTHLARWRSWPLAGVVHTAIDNDGGLQGPGLGSLREVCAAYPGDVFASGGVTTLDDVEACHEAGAAGAIVGRALHEGLFDLRAAIERFADGAAS